MFELEFFFEQSLRFLLIGMVNFCEKCNTFSARLESSLRVLHIALNNEHVFDFTHIIKLFVITYMPIQSATTMQKFGNKTVFHTKCYFSQSIAMFTRLLFNI